MNTKPLFDSSDAQVAAPPNWVFSNAFSWPQVWAAEPVIEIALLHSRKDVVAVAVTDADETRIALAWPTAATTERVEEFIGIVRGRTAQSSRSTPTPPTPKVAPPKKVVQPRKKEQSAGRTRPSANRRSKRR